MTRVDPVDGALAVIRWAADLWGPQRCVLTASMEDAVMIDLLSQAAPGVEVVFIDTGFHFEETLSTAKRVRRRYSALTIRDVGPGARAEPIWETGDTDGCCAVNKVKPFETALAGRRVWFSGVRRADSPERARAGLVERDGTRGVVKVNPIVDWTDEDVASYVADRDVIVNPLFFDGYGSVGCAPCTVRGEGRAGRWAASAKTECGLHGRPGA